MDGVTSQSLRDKGVKYHLNWGANLLHLSDMAREYEPSVDLAVALWNDDIRECKILATMLMPPDEFPISLAVQWIDQTPTQEIAEIASTRLFCHLPYARELAMQLITPDQSLTSASPIALLYGYSIICRLPALTQSDIEKILSFAAATVACIDLPIGVRHAAHNVIMRLECS